MQHQHPQPADRDPRTLARRDNPDTSKAAAQRAREFAANHREQIVRALRLAPYGLTVHEIATFTKLDAHAVGKRMAELEGAGLAYVDHDIFGQEVTRPSPSGRAARVWQLKRFATKDGGQ